MIADSNSQPGWLEQRLRASDAGMRGVHPLPLDLGAEGEAGRLDVMVDQGGKEFVDRQDLRRHSGGGGVVDCAAVGAGRLAVGMAASDSDDVLMPLGSGRAGPGGAYGADGNPWYPPTPDPGTAGTF